MQLAQTLAKSGLIPKALFNKPGDVLVILLTGRELGLGPMQSLRGINVIDGKAVLSADLMVGLCVARRDVCEWFRFVESDAKHAKCATKRAGAPEPQELTWTLEQARAAGLTGKQNWAKYPEAMLRARCASALVRAVYPDLMAGSYDPDEMGRDEAPESIEPKEVEAKREPPATAPQPALPAVTAPVAASAKRVTLLDEDPALATKPRVETPESIVSKPRLPAALEFGATAEPPLPQGSPIDKLSDAELTRALNLGESNLRGGLLKPGPKAKLERNLNSLREELKARAAWDKIS